MTNPVEWSAARRIGVRFAVVFGALLVYPFPIGVVPKTEDLEIALGKPLEWGAQLLATVVFGLPEQPTGFNGSGDRTLDYFRLLLVAILAVLATIAWSALDRQRRSYARLAVAAWIVLRYYVASAMVIYGVAKIMKSQFYDLSPGVLHQRLGETPPMKLLWAFMGYSLPYTVFAGLAETVGGALLLWRRTVTLGALLVVGVMANVVLLNFGYDVPVKLFAMQLLVMAVAIAVPDARRLFGAVLGRATPEVPPRTRMSPRFERARLIAKVAMIGSLAVGQYLQFAGQPSRNDHTHELYGNWVVDGFVIDGVEHPPLTTDPVRWESWSANPTYMQIWLMDGTFEGRNGPERGWYGLEVDPAAHTITVTIDSAKQIKETWTYARPTPDRLVIDCVHRGKTLHVTLRREPEGLLMTRGFHWINEVPYNR
jgi:uncharacterized membrane protein YphA (DoxX/SURF4 family)